MSIAHTSRMNPKHTHTKKSHSQASRKASKAHQHKRMHKFIRAQKSCKRFKHTKQSQNRWELTRKQAHKSLLSIQTITKEIRTNPQASAQQVLSRYTQTSTQESTKHTNNTREQYANNTSTQQVLSKHQEHKRVISIQNKHSSTHTRIGGHNSPHNSRWILPWIASAQLNICNLHTRNSGAWWWCGGRKRKHCGGMWWCMYRLWCG